MEDPFVGHTEEVGVQEDLGEEKGDDEEQLK